ncbi:MULTISPECIES: erythromycin esterase family protein [Actinoalloteichus]|uniref:erythromycin esterase family protein n=1 Tax=Actinoalloteichus TaxID=65496 RepID=UPI00267EA100
MSTPPVLPPDPSPPVAAWLTTQPVGARPELIAEAAREAVIVGLGVSTREAHEVFAFVTDTTWLLVERGFTTIAVLDNQRVADLYDRYVSGEDIDLDRALAQAWGPWQVVEMRDALVRLRELNRTRTGARVRIVGVASSRVLSSDYDRVVDLLAGIDASTAVRVEALLDVIRVAHGSGEHVLRARGTHPGTPFVEMARTARAHTARLAPSGERDAALELLDAVVDFHANAIGVGHDMAREEHLAADRLLDHHRRTGERIVLWEGSAHIAAHPGPMLGSHLRTALDDRYLAVHITFGQGHITRATIPAPRADSIDARLAGAHGERTIDLRTPPPATVAGDLGRSWPTRLISGLYDPADDDEHYFDLPSLTGSFDALVYIPTITPIRPLADE